MGRLPPGRGIAARIALAALLSAALVALVLGLGVGIVGADLFRHLMEAHGASAAEAQAMFDGSISRVMAAAVLLAAAASLLLAWLLARRIARPLGQIGAAARRVADGDYATRVPRAGPEELRELADSFNQMAASLEEGERLRRDLVSNTAHELRTPLTNLQGYLEALRDGVVAADRETYQSLWDEADRLTRLARSLEDLAEGDRRRRPTHLVDLDLVPVLAAALELARPGFEARALDVEHFWPERLAARADPDQLAQVLANLLQNAQRYTPDRGRVRLAAEERPGSVLVSVSNTGEVIPAAELPHLFERFYRVEKSRDRARGGAGIGLAIVKQLVEAWGGRVGAESTSAETRFWFSLPD
jgi:signal transduction histidine kinase